ncbi:MAG TPA: enoyl-CoA hydratase/isomerase family protein [Phycisphaerales bacterium]|nr:enoyl-CoA hydratase/isomerase family protein [Phycisphaerales bacterium]
MANAAQTSLERLPTDRDAHGVVTLILRQPSRPVVVLDWALLRAIDATLDEIGRDLAGFVLASDSRVFIAGADLKEIVSLSDAELDRYLAFGQHVYGRIAKLPCTTVAAINGAVLGGGLEIAMHCDHLIALAPKPGTPEKPSRPYAVGLPEAGLSICPGWGGTNMLPARMDAATAIAMTATGKTFTVLDAKQAGLVEELVQGDTSALLARARAIATARKKAPRSEPVSITNADKREKARVGLESVKSGGELPRTQAAAAVLDCVEKGLNGGWQACLDAERAHLIRLRGTDEGKAAIKAFFEKQ